MAWAEDRLAWAAARRASRLGHVGAGDLADLEAGLGLFQLAVQDGDVLLGDAQAFLVAAHVDIALDDVAQHRLLDAAQVLAPASTSASAAVRLALAARIERWPRPAGAAAGRVAAVCLGTWTIIGLDRPTVGARAGTVSAELAERSGGTPSWPGRRPRR
jgi:hypothetical protein